MLFGGEKPKYDSMTVIIVIFFAKAWENSCFDCLGLGLGLSPMMTGYSEC